MGGARHSTVSSAQEWPTWEIPGAQSLYGQALQTMLPGGQVGQMPSNLNQQLAPFTQAQLQGLQGMQGAAGQMAPLGAAGEQLGLNTLGGAYLNPQTNPYLQQTYDIAAKGLTDQYQTATAPGLQAEAL